MSENSIKNTKILNIYIIQVVLHLRL